MFEKTGAEASAVVVLSSTSALLGEYAWIGFGALFGSALLASWLKTESRFVALVVMFRAWGFSMLFSLPAAYLLQGRAAELGVPFQVLLAPLAGAIALFSENLLGLKDRFFEVLRDFIAWRGGKL